MTTDAQPKRIQRRRVKGWRMPAGVVYVGRGSMFGNRWRIGDHSNLLGRDIATNADAVHVYRELGNDTPEMRAMVREKLAGKDLACWCRLDQPCHADVLLEIANTPEVRS